MTASANTGIVQRLKLALNSRDSTQDDASSAAPRVAMEPNHEPLLAELRDRLVNIEDKSNELLKDREIANRVDHGPMLDELRERLVNIEDKSNELLKDKAKEKLILPGIAPEIVNMPNPRLQPWARRIFSLLRPQDVAGKSFVRKGRDYDGGYLMLDHGLENATVYSMGISDDASWDVDMAALGCDVYQYDHTIDRFPAEHPKFHSFKIGICGRPVNDPKLKTIDQLIGINKHHDQHDMILKMDIEGAEWNVLADISEATMARFSQIVIELHWLTHVDDIHRLRRIIAGLEKLNQTHQVVHVHANNCGRIALIAGVLLPDSMEVALVRKTDHSFSECRRIFPTELDMPCNHAAADFFLGALGLL
jgi:FkbM family methyltransferase